MATVASAVQSFDLTSASGGSSIREDLANIIFNVDASDTPFFSMAQKASASSVLHEWWTDSYAPAAANAKVEAEDLTATQGTARTRLNNRIQISQKLPLVSTVADLVDTSPISREMAHQMAKMTIELRRDVELACVGAGNAKVAGTDSVAAEAANLSSWMTNGSRTGGASTGVSGNGTDVPAGGANRTFTDTIYEADLAQIWTDTGPFSSNMVAMLNTTLKSTFNGFTGIATNTFNEAADRSIINAVDVYVSDYGDLRVLLNRHMTTESVYSLDMDHWAIAFLGGSPVVTKDLASQGDYTKTLLSCYWTIEARGDKTSAQTLDLDA